MRILSYILAGIAVLAMLIVIIGFALPKAHTAAVRAEFNADPQRIYAAIADVENGPRWRTGLQKVEVLSRDPVTWRETADWGTITFRREEAVPNQLLTARIADESEGFGGTWTYALAPSSNGTSLTITENGTVSNPLFRFMSKFVFGHYTSLETYASDLAKLLGEQPRVARVGQ
jgi:uncharacterized protein YndB with AHSA1/START domain